MLYPLLLVVTIPLVAAGDTWSAYKTSLLQPVRVGARELVVQDCRHFTVGSRVRISFATEEEEEGSVSAVSCSDEAGAQQAHAELPAIAASRARMKTAASLAGRTVAQSGPSPPRARQLFDVRRV